MTNTTHSNDEKVKRSHGNSYKGEKRSKKIKLEDKLGLSDNKSKQQQRNQGTKSKQLDNNYVRNNNSNNNNNTNSTHRFGKVMIDTPKRNKPRNYTLSIAVPGSFVSNAVTLELSTYLVGQIARAATIYNVDEIIVYNDNLSNSKKLPFRRRREKPHQKNSTTSTKPSTPEIFLRKLLEYCECPQYLRKDFFPFHPDFQFVGMLPPLDAPHHVREWDTHCRFREGVVLDKAAATGMSLVNVGLKKYIEIDRKLVAGIRVTVEIIDHVNSKGKVVSPSRPNEIDGTYWGYTTRFADNIQKVFDECPYDKKNGYDVKIGTSERGNKSIDDDNFTLSPTNNKKRMITANNISKQHMLVVFGGVAGIEECIDADESLKISGEDTYKMFDCWLNACPLQGSRTIRTEEAVLLTLARLNPIIEKCASGITNTTNITSSEEKIVSKPIEFSDASVSEESSDSDND